MSKSVLLLVPGSLLIVGCTPVDYGFGETTRWNIEQQVVDPDPEYAGTEMEGGSGQRGADAVDRYNQGAVIQPVPVTTTSSSSSSGSSPSAGTTSSGSGPR